MVLRSALFDLFPEIKNPTVFGMGEFDFLGLLL